MRADDDRDELGCGRDAEQRHIKTGVISQLIERSLHERVGHHADDGTPRLWLSGVEGANAAANRAFLAKPSFREAGVDDCHRLLRVGVIKHEVAAFQDF